MENEKFEGFYMREYQTVLALAHVLTGDRTRAEDVAHDAFLAAFESWERLSDPEQWIRRVVANKSRSMWRRRYAERRALARLESEAHPFDEIPESTEHFWSLVRTLPSKPAQAVALYYLEDRSLRDIASILGCKESTARGHLSKGRRALAKMLEVTE